MAGGTHHRSPPLDLRGRILALSALALTATFLFAFVAGRSGAAPLTALAILALSLIALLAISRALAPLTGLSRDLAHCAGSDAERGVSLEQMSTQLRQISERLVALSRRAARHSTTGLPVREEFAAAVAQDLAQAPGSPHLLGLIRFANLDHMVAYDAAFAERVLKAFALRLQSATTRPLGHVDRDCFAIWFGAAHIGEANRELQALSYVLGQEFQDGQLAVTPDIQVGSALYPTDTDDAASLLSRALVSLARPQRTADGGIAFFARPSAEDARKRFSLEQDLRRAVRRGELELHYQPFVDVDAGELVGAEALLRWHHATRGEVSPSQFIPILEESGLMQEIGLWVLNAACRQLQDWRDTNLAGLRIAINLSAHQVRDPSLQRVLERTLASHSLMPAQIELELTETAAMEDGAYTRKLFSALKEAGFSLAIDDFGSGYSSLAYLKTLPFNKLKIDRAFVTHVDTRADSRAICKALVELTHGLGLSVLAEGVERLEEVETLRGLGCTTFQGFYFSKPMPAEKLATLSCDSDWLGLLRSGVRRQQAELRRRIQ